MYFPIKAIVLTSVMFLVLFLAISLITPFFIRKQQIIRLLKTDKKSEKKYNFLVKLFVGVVTVGLSLVAMTIKNDASFIRPLVDSDFSVIVLLIIFLIGMYPLYMQLSLVIITTIQKTNYYLQKQIC